MMAPNVSRSPGVRFPPPLIRATGLMLGWLLETRVRRWYIAESASAASALDVIGGPMLLAGAILAAWGAATFVRHKTAILPNAPASTIVTSGPFRYTRNPMYAGFSVAYVGATLLLNAVWPLVMLPPALLVLYWCVIRREERYLTGAFGDEYAAYRKRVRRWL